MDPFGKEELIAFYNRHLRDFGDSPMSVRWTPAGQRRRYEILLQIAGDINGKNLLLVREAMHINGLSYYDNSPRDIELFYVRPEDIIGFVVEQLSGYMVYRHGMVKGDYFLSVYKNAYVTH
ncbi:hypothetical protein BMS3Bbin06_00254 [bacterium BMS3Bbin06]|nr:hypothetical protein BMS3Abin08_01708 [bacterium BMS3Abin08]GBE33740.1 hypothetical protein BMS3Bbin06_00254 [bacterium BMS3Bbin06]HDO36060.1 hypothetical protein [Nitrospirota bacterium]HDY70243.1 hypothetical protein [Nitrospirota bacterium]